MLRIFCLKVGARRSSVLSRAVERPRPGIQRARRLFARICLVCLAGGVLATPVSGQQVWVRAYESVEDLWESYVEGELTDDQYRDLLELFSVGADSILRPAWDREELPGFSSLDSMTGVPRPDSATASSKSGRAARHELRWGYTLPVREGADEEGYLIVRRRSDRVSFLVEGQARDGAIDGFRRRGITYHDPRSHVRITLGNFEPRYGLGLIVGRRDRILGRTASTRTSGSIWQAQRAKYNGIFLQLNPGERFRLGVLGSRIENDRYREDLGAIHLALHGREGKSQFGLTAAGGNIADRVGQAQMERFGVGFSASTGGDGHTLEAEAGISGKASAAAVRAVRPIGNGRCSLTLWSYDPDFLVFSSGGPGHPGRGRVRLLGDDLDYYSRTAGEQGLLLVQRTPAGKCITIESQFEIYNERLEHAKSLEGVLSCRVKAARRMSIAGYLRGRERHGQNDHENLLYFGCSGETRLPGDWPVKWRMEYGTVRKESIGRRESVRLEFQTAVSVNRYIRLTPRIRYIDPDLSNPNNGYFYAYLTERVPLVENSDLEIVAVVKGYEDSDKTPFADVRVRVSWRP